MLGKALSKGCMVVFRVGTEFPRVSILPLPYRVPSSVDTLDCGSVVRGHSSVDTSRVCGMILLESFRGLGSWSGNPGRPRHHEAKDGLGLPNNWNFSSACISSVEWGRDTRCAPWNRLAQEGALGERNLSVRSAVLESSL